MGACKALLALDLLQDKPQRIHKTGDNWQMQATVSKLRAMQQGSCQGQVQYLLVCHENTMSVLQQYEAYSPLYKSLRGNMQRRVLPSEMSARAAPPCHKADQAALAQVD